MLEGQIVWTRDLWNIGFPSLTTPSPLKSQKNLFCDRALGSNLLQPKGDTACHDPTPKDPVNTFLSHTKVSKKIYECLINEKASIPSRSQGKWLEERDIHCNLSIIVNWENTYCLSSLCTRESKLRAFQFKFLHRKIATNDFLCKIGIKQTDSCSFCEEQKETLVHLFWTCRYTQNFWKSMFEWMSQNFKDLENVSPSLSLCFGLIDDVKDLLFHHLLLIARHNIYTCRLGNKLPKLQVYIQVLMNSIESLNLKPKMLYDLLCDFILMYILFAWFICLF